MVSFSEIMKGIIFQKGRGNFITPEDFGNQVSSASLRTELVNFNNSHFLIHVARGLYFFPHIGKDRKPIKPTIIDIIRYVEESTKSTIYPSIESACKIVGLDDSYLSTMEFYTNGSTKKINLTVGPELIFKKQKKSDKLPNYESLKVRILVMAYASIANKRITKEQKEIMNTFCSSMNYDEVAQDITNLPEWMIDNLSFPKPIQENE